MSKIVMTEQSSAPDTPGSGKVAIYMDSNGDLSFRKDDGTITKIASAGTYTLTIPATGTAALLGTAQTFSAAQTFSNVLTAPGIKPASNSTTAIQLQNATGTAVLTVDTTNSRAIATALAIAAAGNLLYQPVAGVVRQKVATTSVAIDGTLVIQSSEGVARCFFVVFNSSNGHIAVGAANGTSTTLLYASPNMSATKDTADNINIYVESNQIIVQNKRSAARDIAAYVIL